MRTVFEIKEVPEHLREFFTPVGGGDGVEIVNLHPT